MHLLVLNVSKEQELRDNFVEEKGDEVELGKRQSVQKYSADDRLVQ